MLALNSKEDEGEETDLWWRLQTEGHLTYHSIKPDQQTILQCTEETESGKPKIKQIQYLEDK